MAHYSGATAAPSIVLSQDSEVRYWTRELGVDAAHLRRAIASVGPDEVDVRHYLAQARHATASRGHIAAEDEPTGASMLCPA